MRFVLFFFLACIYCTHTSETDFDALHDDHRKLDRVNFNQNGKFKIAIFTDLHYAEGPATDWGPMNDLKSSQVMRDILLWENPDFVVYTGDLISEEYLVTSNGTAYIDILLQPVIEGNYKWASTYGNHDSGIIISREDILATEQKYSNAYTQHGGPDLPGTTNYFVPVYASSNENETSVPALILWFFDSRGGRSPTGGFPATVDEAVIQWFKNETDRMKIEWGPVPSFAYFHYPTKEYQDVHDDLIFHPECTGQHDDIVNPQDPDTRLLTALVESGMVKATFVGHNHANGWCCNYGVIVLCYNRQSGHGGGWVGRTRGSRIVEISLNNPWGQDVNYVRLENGTIVDYFPKQ